MQPAPDVELDDALRSKIGAAIRDALSPRHVPDRILAVSGVPRNLTGKKLEVPVKQVLRGVDVDTVVSRQAMADPTALDSVLDAIARR